MIIIAHKLHQLDSTITVCSVKSSKSLTYFAFGHRHVSHSLYNY